MQLNDELSKVIAEMEYLIGSECYNPNSYDGWHDEEGKDFRYPVHFPIGMQRSEKVREKITNSYFVSPQDITPSNVLHMLRWTDRFV